MNVKFKKDNIQGGLRYVIDQLRLFCCLQFNQNFFYTGVNPFVQLF